MIQYTELLRGIVITSALISLLSISVFAADSAIVNFSAKISDGTCDIQLSQTALEFGIYKPVDFEPSTAVAVLPLTAIVTCSGATIPTLTLTGITPYISNAIFRDTSGSVAQGVGFMVRRDSGNIDLGSFYNESSAIKNNISIPLSSVSTAEKPQNESFLLGLVRAGSDVVTPGAIKATLTITISFD